jgi:microcin C transport system permease protein
LWVFLVFFVATLFAELIANDKPLIIVFEGEWMAPFITEYPETRFGGLFETEADYRDPVVRQLIEEGGWMAWPLIPYSFDTINYNLQVPAPSPPTMENWLGTDDQGRDVLARLIYGFRISVLFGLILTLLSSLIGIMAGAVQGYLGGWTDLLFQRFIEIWSGLPTLYLLIIMASVVEPNFWWLLGLMLLFSWMGLVGVVRAEFLRARNFDYARAAQALGVGTPTSSPMPWWRPLPFSPSSSMAQSPPSPLLTSLVLDCPRDRPRWESCWLREKPISMPPGSE